MDWNWGNRTRRPQKTSVGSRVFLVIFGLLFFSMGAGFMYLIVVKPVWGVLAARAWRETPCRVVSSEVRSHSGSKGTTYSVKIRYAYTVEGRQFESSRYDFTEGSSSGYKRKAKI